MLSHQGVSASSKCSPLGAIDSAFLKALPPGFLKPYKPAALSPLPRHRIEAVAFNRGGFVEVVQQGRVSKLKVSFPVEDRDKYQDCLPTPVARPPRGLIKGFSRPSRKRFIEDIQRLSAADLGELYPKFISLTYRHQVDAEEAKGNLRSLFERFRRRWPQSSGYWRMELQKRGVFHFHLIMFGLPWLPHVVLQGMWEEIIGWDLQREGCHVQVNIKAIESVKMLTNYVAKYAAKLDDSLPLLDNASYLHAGRWWGKFNKAHLPYAPVQRMLIPIGRWFFGVRRLAKKIYRGVKTTNRFGIIGFTVYLDQSVKLFEWIQTVFMDEQCQYVGDF